MSLLYNLLQGFTSFVAKWVNASRQKEKTMSFEETAKEIIISMIQHDKILPQSPTGSYEEKNSSYIAEVCKAFNMVYQTVKEASKHRV
jgi:hypothetical protein